MFYEVYSRLCAQRGEAETTVCRNLGIAPSAPKFWREGKEPRPSTLKKIADYFGVDVSFFDHPFPEAPISEPSSIPVHVITMEEATIISKLQQLSDGDREFVLRIIDTLANK